MRKLLNAIESAAALLSLLVVASCASPSAGPVQPMTAPGAPGVLVIDPALAAYLDVPNAQQNYSYNAGGLLEYNTVVRNRGPGAMTLAYEVYCTDDAGRVTEPPSQQRFFIDSQSEVPLQIAANDRRSRKMRVQIRPAK